MAKKYDVFGIGNALVDMEIEIEESFLEEGGIQKGFMTLVDKKRQEELLALTKDLRARRSCGGSAANTVIGLSQFGGKGFYSCKVANDETGNFYFADLLENGVGTNLHNERETGDTGKCLVFITPDADRTMNTFLGITANFSTNEISFEELKESDWLYIEGYLVTGDSSREAAIEARKFAQKNGIKVSLTLSDPAMPAYFRDGIKEMIGDSPIDLLFCNEEEALALTETDSFEKAKEEIKKFSKGISITRGDKGAWMYDGVEESEVSAPQVTPKDTNGAGDLFAGSFLYGIINGHSYEEAGKLACQSASELVTKFGARLEKSRPKEIYSTLF